MSRIPNNIVGIDLGNHSLKAIRLQRKDGHYALTGAAMVPAQLDMIHPMPPTELNTAVQIKELASIIKFSGADVHYTVNSLNGAVRYVESPRIPLQEIRSALKLNSAAYLRQNFENYVFDVCPLDKEAAEALAPPKRQAVSKGAPPPVAQASKIKILVGGISTVEISLFFHASNRAGVKPRSLQLAPISLINGFEAAYPDIFRNQAVALLDFGFLSSSLTILDKGTPLLTRIVPVGGKQITEYIAHLSNLDFVKAETAKLQGDPRLNDAVVQTTSTLIHEVRSSINFFEKNSDEPISTIYLAGGSMSSPVMVEVLSNEVGAPCKPWDPTQGLTVQLPLNQQDLFSKNLPSFSAALGVARTYATTPAPQKTTAPAPPQPPAAA